MPSNFTENYNLSQWERTDQVRMEDFNTDNAKIDTAIKAEADTRTAGDAALQAVLGKKGNCSLSIFAYTGNGKYGSDNPTRITFPRMPALFIISGSALLVGQGGAGRGTLSHEFGSYGHTGNVSLSWSGNTLSLVHNNACAQMNEKSTYTVFAFYVES